MRAARITLDQWRALVAVVDAGGYAKAAEKLHKSQSSVTYAVQQIETQLDVKAFELQGRRAQLTPTGQLLYRRALYLLEEAARIEQAAQRLSAGWEAEVRLAVEFAFPTWLLLECLNQFSEEGPNTRVEVIEVVFGHHTDVLASSRADLCIYGTVPSGYVGEPLLRLRFVPVAAPTHPLHKLGRTLTARDLRKHRHLVIRETSERRPTATTLESTQRWTVGQMSTAIEAARAGFGFCLVPEDLIRDELQSGALRQLPFRDGGTHFEDLYLIYADREHAGPATQRLAQILREHAARHLVPQTATPTPPARQRARRRGA